MSSHHRILGIPTNASILQIKRAYYKKAKVLHPDVNKSPKAEEEFVRLNMAYEALTNPKFSIPKIQFNKTKYKSTEEKRRESIRKKQELAKKRAEEIARKYRNRNSNIKPKDILKRDLLKIGKFGLGLTIMLTLGVALPATLAVSGFTEKIELFTKFLIGFTILNIILTAPVWIGIISFYLFPEKK